MKDLKIILESDGDLASCVIKKRGKVTHIEGLERKDQIRVCNALAQFYRLFVPCVINQDKIAK